MDRTAARTLAVVVKGYPRLSETFIAQELLALQERGFVFDIWSLREPYDDRTHPIHDQIVAGRHYLPEYLHEAPLRVIRAVLAARRLPGFRRMLRIWLRDLTRDFNRNRIRRFGQACVLATDLPEDVQFLYVHFLHTPASVVRYTAGMRGLDWAFSAHAKDIWTIPDWEKAEKIADCAFGVTCTQSGAEELMRWGADKVTRVYHGLDLTRFPNPPEARTQSKTFRLLSVGRLVEKKGYDTLLDAFTLLPDWLDWQFTHIGGGKLDKEMRARAERLGVDKKIHWLGKKDQTEVIAALREADLFVLPSKIAGDGDRDGLPNVLMEAASQKLPILSTRVSAIPEFVRNGVDGILTPPGDAHALASAIAQLASDPEGRAAMAESAHARLTAEFGMAAGIDTIAGRLSAAMGAR
ncbi:MAG: glycosyltransferase family 4 protein [Pseudomonadota bacterium]